MTLDDLIRMKKQADEKDQAEMDISVPDDPRAWVEQQLEDISDVTFAARSDSSWESSKLVHNTICKLVVSVHDSVVEVAAITSIIPTERTVAQIRILQMYENGTIKVRGFSKAKVGEPIEFRTRIQATNDLSLESIIRAASSFVSKCLPRFKQIQEGVSAEKAYFEEQCELVAAVCDLDL